MTSNAADTAFGALLRAWRQSRRLSQEKLALEADVSTRHLSYVETGRARPSREMVLLLANVLDVPLRERNRMLTAAGFAPAYRHSDYGAPEMAPIRNAVEFMLERHEPYGAVVVDSAWNLMQANRGAERLFSAFVTTEDAALRANLLRLLVAPGGLRHVLDNWAGIACAAIQRTRWEASTQGPNGPAVRILEELLTLPDLPREAHRIDVEKDGIWPLVVPLTFRRGDLVVKLFTTITTLGTPADVTAQELRLETWFPADEASDAWCRQTMT